MEVSKESKSSTFDSKSYMDRYRVTIDQNLRRWFSRNLGTWHSKRTYFFSDEGPLNVEIFLKIQQYKERFYGDFRYLFDWWVEKDQDFFIKKSSYESSGQTTITLLGHQLFRSEFYLTNTSGKSNIKQVDEHELIFESNYSNWHIIEQTRLINEDQYRSRSIYSWENDDLKIVENHHEIKIDSSLELVEN